MIRASTRLLPRIALSTLVLFVLSGCKTTGDPTSGGLFGWSEDKAKTRQQNLSQQLADKQSQVADAQQQNKQLEAKNASLLKIKSQQQAVLEKLLIEQSRLTQQLQRLKKQNKLSSQELATIQAENPWLQKSRQQVLEEFRQLKQDNIFDQQLKKLASSNESLTKEIILLIGR